MLVMLLALLLVPATAVAQVPTQCLEIESILVDACAPAALCPGSSEAMNEMVRFKTGPVDIALSDLEADWPNNNWLGLVQNAATATLTATLNDGILSCGYLVEPPGGIIPAGSSVLLITSTQMCTAANSFANLADTLHVIFQNPGNSSGHFGNQNNGNTVSPVPTGPSDLRTLILTYLPTGCADTVSYDRSLLVNNLGTYGGTSGENDGSTVTYTWPGVPQVGYQNNGCQAPVVVNEIVVNLISGSLCGGNGQVTVEAVPAGNFQGGGWSGGTGTFDDPTALTATYIAGAGDLGDVTLFFTGSFSCGDPLVAPIVIPAGQAPVVGITPNGSTALCPGGSIELTGTGADTYVWSTGETTESITVSQAGTVSVSGTNACGTADEQIEITMGALPNVSITPSGSTALCPGETVTLTASGADSYSWSTGETTSAITVGQAGTIIMSGQTACGNDTAEIEITSGAAPNVSISGPSLLCPGDAITLTATGADSYVWSTLETGASISVTQEGTYFVTGTTACGSADASATVSAIMVNAAFTPSVLSGNAPLEVSFANTSTPSSAVPSWSFGDGEVSADQDPVHVYAESGSFIVTLLVTDQGCTASAQATITVFGENGQSSVVVPNVFTPNGDGINDQFALTTVGIRSLTLRIFNRYGQEIALLERPQQVWDGRTFSGEPASDGTYFFVLEANGSDGESFDLTGHITLLR